METTVLAHNRECPVRPVDILRWPADAGQRRDRLARGRGCLWVVDTEATPPTIGPGEDWVWRRSDERDLFARLSRLSGRLKADQDDPSLEVDDDGNLTRNGTTVILSPTEAAVTNLLGAHLGRVVPRSALATASADNHVLSPRSIDRTVHRLRDLLGPLGLELHTIRGRGFLLDLSHSSNPTVPGSVLPTGPGRN